MALFDMAQRVRRGVKLLDAKVPNWRRILRRHREEFDFADGECCVLGTLEHYRGLRKLKLKNPEMDARFDRALDRLRIDDGGEFGFDVADDELMSTADEYDMLSELWRAEFETK